MREDEDERTLWGVILPYVKRQAPAALSSPPRSALRQPDLCNAARVSSLFSSLVDPILYSSIITDDCPALLANAHLPSMQRRFAMCKSLHLEYGAKGLDAPYLTLVTEGRAAWQGVGRMRPWELEAQIMAEAEAEIKEIGRTLKTVLTLEEKIIFPCVETVAIAAFYGSSDNVFSRYNDSHPSERDRQELNQITVDFDQFLVRLPRLRAICLRNSDGPLAIGTAPIPSQSMPPIIRTIHFDTNVRRLHLDPGVPLRLVSDTPSDKDWAPLSAAIQRAFQLHLPFRAPHVRGAFGSAVMDVSIYSSTWQLSQPMAAKPTICILDIAFQMKIAAERGDELQRMYRQTSGLADKIRWYASESTPSCPCCQTGAPAWPFAEPSEQVGAGQSK